MDEPYPTVQEWVSAQLDRVVDAIPEDDWTALRIILGTPEDH